MKKFTLTAICTILAIAALAQAPQGISHQAVIRNAANELVANSPIGIKVSILQGSAAGIVVYSETHLPVSNANGLISFVIGQGSVVSGIFAEIDWASGPYFIKTEADPAGGTNYTITGTSQVWSVPYAVFSQKSATLKDGNAPGEILYWSGLEWIAIQPGEHNQVLRLCNGIPTWGLCKFLLSMATLPENGGAVSGAGLYEAGAQVNITATANTGWQFVNWIDAIGVVSQAPNFIYTMPEADATLTANFEMIDYTLTLVSNPIAGGSLSGGGVYNFGNAVSVGAIANTGYTFVNWTDANGVVSQTPNFIYTMPAADVALTANFEMIDYTLTLSANPTEGGSVSGGGVYNFGNAVQLGAVANTGWQFVNWTDDDGIVSQAANFTYAMPAEDITLTANFIEEQVGFTCGNPFTDSRDGQSYNTVQIGNQCWMAENLKYLPSVVGPGTGSNTVPYYYVYGYNGTSVSAAKATANYQTYGALYNWSASLTACPTGWHLPSDAEWTALTTYVSNQPEYLCNSNTTYIAKSLAATTNWITSSSTCAVGNNLSANNATGFSGLPGGYRSTSVAFKYIGGYGLWWSATEYSTAFAWYRFMFFINANVGRANGPKGYGYSVRCLRDN
jgi:uncharacterized protein (TIGR02145 family)/uncharacterized repeat protein (TIGR02543 family)